MRVPSMRATGTGYCPAAFERFVQSPALAIVQALTLLAMTGSVVSRLWQDHLWFGVALVAVAAIAWAPELAHARIRRWWFVYVAGTFVYTLLRALADETFISARTRYVIDADRLLFLGHDPVVSLQERFFDTASVSPLDVFAVGVHWSFFIAPHAMAIAIFIWRRDLFSRYVALVVGTLYLGLALFFLVPTTPPWLAAQHGALPGAFRVMDFVGGKVNGDTYREFYASLGEPNSVAAMPSIHMAVTFAMYLWSRTHAKRFAWPLLAYSAIMALALVYLAEHYVLDLIVGATCAVVSALTMRRFFRSDRRAVMS